MDNDEFCKAFYVIFERALSTSKICSADLLALEESLDEEKAADRDIFDYGMRFVVDGTDYSLIDKILSNIVRQEKDELQLLLKTIQKEAVLAIQQGLNPREVAALLNSYTDIPPNDPVYQRIVGDNW